MKIPSGSTDRYLYFVAVDATDLKTRETALSSFTVYRSRNGGAAAAMTTPTINETSSANMPGVYELLLDEDTTLDAGHDSEEMVLHITHAGMAPVTRVVELYRPKLTEGRTLAIDADGGLPWNADWDAEVESEATDAITAASLATAAALTTVEGKIDTVDTVVDAIKAKTDNLPTDPADQSAVEAAITAATSGLATEVAAIKAKTDNLPTDPADQSAVEAAITAATSGLATAAALATVDTVVDAILVDTDTTIPALIAAINTGSGSGAYTITVTVTDGTDPLQNATVRLVEGVNQFTAVTDASGEAAFSLDAATYTVTVTKDGYQFTPTTRTVTGAESGTLTNDLEMTAVVLATSTTTARLVTFQSVLYGVARRRGLEPGVNLQDNEAAALTEYINAAYEFCWRFAQWPESLTIEAATATDQLIPWAGETTYRIGDVLRVTARHPVTDSNPGELKYTLGPAGLYLTDSAYADSEVYLIYRREAPRFTQTLYSASATYAVNDLIYFTDGDCYRCLSATSAGQSPTTHAAKWQRQDLLAILAEATKQAALAEALREDGQHSTSLITDGALQGLLEHEFDRLTLDQRQEHSYRFNPSGR